MAERKAGPRYEAAQVGATRSGTGIRAVAEPGAAALFEVTTPVVKFAAEGGPRRA